MRAPSTFRRWVQNMPRTQDLYKKVDPPISFMMGLVSGHSVMRDRFFDVVDGMNATASLHPGQ